MNRDELIRGVDEYFAGYTPKFYVTLNTKIVVYKPHEVELKSIAADRKVGVMIGWLKEYCMGKSRTSLMKAYAFYEAGKTNGVPLIKPFGLGESDISQPGGQPCPCRPLFDQLTT